MEHGGAGTNEAGRPPVEIHEAQWWNASDEDASRIRCNLCPRHCWLAPGDRGFCYVRENRDGRLVSTTYGRNTGLCIDPIEKKPLFHFYPGTGTLSFGTPGCNLGCVFCQNWSTSRAKGIEAACVEASPEDIARTAEEHHCRSVAFTYNDPIVWAEYAIDTAQACRERGIKTVAVTSGYISDAARPDFFRGMDAANVDLKAFTEDFYVSMTGGHLSPVLDTLRYLVRETDVWLEITTLLIPGANDNPEDLLRMCDWILSNLGPDVPLHFTGFHPDFELTDRGPTPLQTLVGTRLLAQRAGLNYVYLGNASDLEAQHTYCPSCRRMVIERRGFQLGAYHVGGGRCQFCQANVVGHFDPTPGYWGGRRQPIDITRPS